MSSSTADVAANYLIANPNTAVLELLGKSIVRNEARRK